MTADTSSGYNSYRRSCLMFRVIMRTTGLFILCLASIPAQSSGLPQTDSLALKSQRAKQLMADGNFAQAIPIYRELNQAVPNNPGLILNLGMALPGDRSSAIGRNDGGHQGPYESSRPAARPAGGPPNACERTAFARPG